MIPFLDLAKINASYQKELEQDFKKFLNAGQYVLGSPVSNFEQEFAAYCQTDHCIGVGNGLDALRLIFEGYKVLGKLEEGDEVLVCAHSYIATILAITQAGLKPAFVDAKTSHFNFDLKQLNQSVSENVKAIIVTHLYGQLGPMEALLAFAEKNDLLLIEDAAQAHGARLGKDASKAAGNFGHAAGFSFYPTKNLGALGDAGAVVTSDSALAEVISALRNYGSSKRYLNKYEGFNSRLDGLQAAFLSRKLKDLDTANDKRQRIAKQYLAKIRNPKISLPFYDGSQNHIFHLFVVRIAQRALLMEHLQAAGIGYLIHYPVPPHKQRALQSYNEQHYPIAEKLADEVLSIPLHPALTAQEVNFIIEALNSF
ncbi:MAG: DegT/DnrJ/EryC1/StrS family aminotransferase [Leeuwenhoekiella sp.]